MNKKFNINRREFLSLVGGSLLAGAAVFKSKDKAIKFFSPPKQNRFLAGVDFEGYEKEVTIELPDGSFKTIEIGYFSSYYIVEFARNYYSNLVSMIPYYPAELYKNEREDQEEINYHEYKFKLIKEGDDMVKEVLNHSKMKDKRYALFRIKDFPAYERFQKEYKDYDILEHLSTNVARVSDVVFAKNSIIELEAKLAGETPEHINKIFKRVKEVYPKIINAISITVHKDSSGDWWYKNYIGEYSKMADMIILNGYFLNPEELKENISNVKKDTKKKVIARILTGGYRKLYGFNGDEKDLESMIKVAYENTDGCIVGDMNGAWLYGGDKNVLDNGRRKAAASKLYFKFLSYKKEESSNPTLPQIFDGMGT